MQKYKVLKNTLPEEEVLLFIEAVHPTQATKITSGWTRTEVDKSTNTTGSRARLNIVGVIDLGNLTGAIFDQFKTVNGDAII